VHPTRCLKAFSDWYSGSSTATGGVPAPTRCPVEVPVSGLDQRCIGVSAAREWAKIVQRLERATWGDF
jgi:hypothetical protein